MNAPLKVGLIADFNAANLASFWNMHSGIPNSEIRLGPFAQTVRLLLDPDDAFWNEHLDTLIVWSNPQLAVPEFAKLARYEEWSQDRMLEQVDSFADLIRTIPANIQNVFLPTWVAPDGFSGNASLEMDGAVGTSNALMRMNLRLADRLQDDVRSLVFNSGRWLAHAGVDAYHDKLWYLSKTPYSNAVFEEAAKDMLAAVDGIRGLRRKIIIVDLDDTLWGGVVGDVGYTNLRLGGHDPVGEAFQAFQQELKLMKNRGIVLAIVSKNEERVAIEALREHPEMVLRPHDFAGWRINWDDKASNILRLMSDLNLGMDSAVFIDDSQFERSRVREALPDIKVPSWPSDPMAYAKLLRRMKCFDAPELSREDRTRTIMYVSDRARKTSRTELGSLECWLESLNLKVIVEHLTDENLHRSAQLLNKTNQMNLTTRRLAHEELKLWASKKGNIFRVIRVSDRFGDYGICGLVSANLHGSEATVVDFVLSCRVMARGVEESMLSVIMSCAQRYGCTRLSAEFISTQRNVPCEKWLNKQPCFQRNNNLFLASLGSTYHEPSHIEMILPEDE